MKNNTIRRGVWHYTNPDELDRRINMAEIAERKEREESEKKLGFTVKSINPEEDQVVYRLDNASRPENDSLALRTIETQKFFEAEDKAYIKELAKWEKQTKQVLEEFAK